jgi:hypothetical protein
LNAKKELKKKLTDSLCLFIGKDVILKKHVWFWCNEFQNWCVNICDEPRSGRSSWGMTTLCTLCNIFYEKSNSHMGGLFGWVKCPWNVSTSSRDFRKEYAFWFMKELKELCKTACMGCACSWWCVIIVKVMRFRMGLWLDTMHLCLMTPQHRK